MTVGWTKKPSLSSTTPPTTISVASFPRAERRPEVRRRVHSRRGRALLALVLERSANDRGRNGVDVRGRVRDDEVLAAGLADDARVVVVRRIRDVLPDRPPHPVEDTGRAG